MLLVAVNMWPLLQTKCQINDRFVTIKFYLSDQYSLPFGAGCGFIVVSLFFKLKIKTLAGNGKKYMSIVSKSLLKITIS